jgi:hypothetical protein
MAPLDQRKGSSRLVRSSLEVRASVRPICVTVQVKFVGYRARQRLVGTYVRSPDRTAPPFFLMGVRSFLVRFGLVHYCVADRDLFLGIDGSRNLVSVNESISSFRLHGLTLARSVPSWTSLSSVLENPESDSNVACINPIQTDGVILS